MLWCKFQGTTVLWSENSKAPSCAWNGLGSAPLGKSAQARPVPVRAQFPFSALRCCPILYIWNGVDEGFQYFHHLSWNPSTCPGTLSVSGVLNTLAGHSLEEVLGTIGQVRKINSNSQGYGEFVWHIAWDGMQIRLSMISDSSKTACVVLLENWQRLMILKER